MRIFFDFVLRGKAEKTDVRCREESTRDILLDHIKLLVRIHTVKRYLQ